MKRFNNGKYGQAIECAEYVLRRIYLLDIGEAPLIKLLYINALFEQFVSGIDPNIELIAKANMGCREFWCARDNLTKDLLKEVSILAPRIFYLLADYRNYGGDKKEAVRAAMIVANAYPNSSRAQFSLAWILCQEKKYIQAYEVLGGLPKDNSDCLIAGRIWLCKAKIFLAIGLVENAQCALTYAERYFLNVKPQNRIVADVEEVCEFRDEILKHLERAAAC